MDSFKEFEGRSLDEAISEACTYFDAPREKLEIDIVQDSKSGIFGLVGARKAKVRACRVQLGMAMKDILGRKDAGEEHGQAQSKEKTAAAPENRREPKVPARVEKPVEKGAEKLSEKTQEKQQGRRNDRQRPVPPVEEKGETQEESGERVAPVVEKNARPDRNEDERQRRQRPRVSPKAAVRGKTERPAEESRRRPAKVRPPMEEPMDGFGDDALIEDGDDLQRIPFEELDQERLTRLSLEVVGRLVHPIVGELPLEVDLHEGRVNVRMDCGDDSGLLIGREGQTLASLQYLASRLVSRGMNAAVRVQLDAGEYRLRQDEKLREMALALAAKVRATGKSHSTRPLSSYHRRIVHVILQDAADVQTRSTGDGPLKRVVIQRKRS